jgi:hypothetical protein
MHQTQGQAEYVGKFGKTQLDQDQKGPGHEP